MTRQEALDYLNLSDSASDRLVRKRYLELHQDYQKAISNAPSEHFRSLYSENLDKIEEAYLLIKGSMPQAASLTADSSPEEQIHSKIKDAQALVNSLMDQDGLVQNPVDAATQKQILGYIDQISQLQDFLQDEPSDEETPEPAPLEVSAADIIPASAIPLTETPIPEVEADPAEESVPADSPAEPSPLAPPENLNGSGAEEISNTAEKPGEDTPQEPEVKPKKDSLSREQLHTSAQLKKNHLRRSRTFNRLLLGSIFMMLLAGMGGMFYMVYPVFFPEPLPQIQPEEETAVVGKSIPHIVGDEFFRTGNYLEALLQYTLAVAEDPENSYLHQQIDSCKVLLGNQPEGIDTDILQEQQAALINRPPTNAAPFEANNANRFRGDEPEDAQEITWNQTVENVESVRPLDSTSLAGNTNTSADQPKPLESENESLIGASELAAGEGEEEWDRDKIWSIVDENPVPIGGYERFAKFTTRRIKYPPQAYKAQVSGIVIVQFVVHKDGSTSGENVVKGIGFGCDEEALRVVKQFTGWMPGKKEGEIVHTKVAVPLYFKLAK